MPRSRANMLALSLFALLLVPVLSCDRGNWPGAPEGYNFRTLHVVYKLEGNVRGTLEKYFETSGYKDGRLHYKRLAQINDYVTDDWRGQSKPRKNDGWLINIEGTQYSVSKPLKRIFKARINLDQSIRLSKAFIWRDILWGVIPRKDVTMAQRDALRAHMGNLSDDDLKSVGARISTETFLGVKVKRYDIPVVQGTSVLLMYGDIPLKMDLIFNHSTTPFRKTIVATRLELNKRLPEAPFTLPKNMKVVDTAKPLPSK